MNTRDRRARAKGRKTGGTFAKIPSAVLESPEYAQLRHPAARLMLDLCGQYNGYNNGKFCATFEMMKRRGWRSEETMRRALKQLLDGRFVVITRYGHRHLAALYGVTFLPIDYADTMTEAQASGVASNDWNTVRRCTAQAITPCGGAPNRKPPATTPCGGAIKAPRALSVHRAAMCSKNLPSSIVI